MREGDNPTRDVILSLNESSHRIIIPLYIPNESDYYSDAFQIFNYCLQSILKTSNSLVKITVVSNGCSGTVNKKLFQLQEEGYIDELIIETEAIGKINSILKAVRTANERLITITDADVLFDNGWEEAVLEVYKAFPKAGSVSPVPVFRTHLRLTCNIWFRNLFSKKLYFRPVKNPKAMTEFAKSIGWRWLDIKYKDVIATLEAKNGTIAVLGCSHFVVTYKREVFNCMPKENTIFQLGGNSELFYTDLPVIKMGGYRLATYDNFAYHMGNKVESWMENKFNNLNLIEKSIINYEHLPKLRKSKLEYFITEKFFRKLFGIKSFYRLVLKYKGLTDEQTKNFIN